MTQPWHHAVARSAPCSFARSDRQRAVVYNQPLLMDQSEKRNLNFIITILKDNLKYVIGVRILHSNFAFKYLYI